MVLVSHEQVTLCCNNNVCVYSPISFAHRVDRLEILKP